MLLSSGLFCKHRSSESLRESGSEEAFASKLLQIFSKKQTKKLTATSHKITTADNKPLNKLRSSPTNMMLQSRSCLSHKVVANHCESHIEKSCSCFSHSQTATGEIIIIIILIKLFWEFLKALWSFCAKFSLVTVKTTKIKCLQTVLCMKE